MTESSTKQNPLLTNFNIIDRVLRFVLPFEDILYDYEPKRPHHFFLAYVCPNWREVLIDFNAIVDILKKYPHKINGIYSCAERARISWAMIACLRAGAEFNVRSEKDLEELKILQKNYEDAVVTICRIDEKFATDATFRQMILACPNLISLNLEGCRELTENSFQLLPSSLRNVNFCSCNNLQDSTLAFIGKNLVQLEELNLRNGCDNISAEGFKHLSSLKNLQVLLISKAEKLSDDVLKNVVAVSFQKTLRRLEISDCNRITNAGFRAVAENCKEIAHLRIDLCASFVDDETLHIISENLSENLEHLDVYLCDKITNKGFKKLAKCKKLKELDFRFCSRITIEGFNSLVELPFLKNVFAEFSGVDDEQEFEFMRQLKKNQNGSDSE